MLITCKIVSKNAEKRAFSTTASRRASAISAKIGRYRRTTAHSSRAVRQTGVSPLPICTQYSSPHRPENFVCAKCAFEKSPPAPETQSLSAPCLLLLKPQHANELCGNKKPLAGVKLKMRLSPSLYPAIFLT
jgi:hypothetical protein